MASSKLKSGAAGKVRLTKAQRRQKPPVRNVSMAAATNRLQLDTVQAHERFFGKPGELSLQEIADKFARVAHENPEGVQQNIWPDMPGYVPDEPLGDD